MKSPHMYSEEDSENRVRAVTQLSPGAHIHISAISGTGMASVAQLLKSLGYYVTGSDKAFYPPMGEVVRRTADKLFEGYRAENLLPRPDLVVIGNNLSKDNVEVQEVLNNNIPFASMPDVFRALLIGERTECPTSIVVAGTHGKTTTTSAIAVMFDRAGWHPGYFIGGVPVDLPASIRQVDLTTPLEQRVVVLEGDEYDSAFFAKRSKFHSYRPDIAVVTSLEFDHADIYSSIDEIRAEFLSFAARLPQDGVLLLCDNSAELAGTPWNTAGKILYYGEAPGSDFRLLKREAVPGKGQRLELSLQGELVEIYAPLSGPQNAYNFLASAAVGKLKGLSLSEISSGLSECHGVLRRQQVRGKFGGRILIEDFAHHPTAIKLTLQGLKESYPGQRIIAVYEPRSNTARRDFFQNDYPPAFKSADLVVIQKITDGGSYAKDSKTIRLLDIDRVVSELNSSGIQSVAISEVTEIVRYLKRVTVAGDVVVVMSNGDFGGIFPMLESELGAE